MEKLTRRPYDDRDAAAVADLFNSIEEHFGSHAGKTPEVVAAVIAPDLRDRTSNSRLVFDGAGTLVAAGIVEPPPAGGGTVHLHGGVLPQWRGRGLGRELLGWQLERARALRRDRAPESTWDAQVGAMADDVDAQRLFRRVGMSPARYWFEMVAPITAGQEPRPLPEGVQVIPYDAAWEQAVHRAHLEAFADHWGFQPRDLDTWAPLTVRSERFLPALSRLALERGEVAGYVLGYRSAEPDRLYVGHVGVRRRWRRHGLATALLRQALAAAAEAGMTTAALGVDADSPTGAVGLYERLGFTVESRAVTFRSPLAVD